MTRRTWGVVVIPLLSIAALWVFLLAVRSRLPDQVAVHWGPAGRADGFVDADTLVWLLPLITLGTWALTAGVAAINRRPIVGAGLLAGLPLGIVWFVGTLLLLTTAIQLDTVSAPPLPWWVPPAGIVAGLVGIVLGGWLNAEPSGQTEGAVVPGGEGDVILWEDTTPTSTAILILLVFLVAVSVMLAVLADVWLTLVFVPIVVIVLASSSFRVRIGRAGLAVTGRGIGFPRVRIPIGQIASAEAGRVDAWNFGGWGLRVASRGESAVLTKSGPALVVKRTDGQTLRVSLDHPEQAAATINGLLTRP